MSAEGTLELTTEEKLSIITSAVCTLLEEHRPQTLEVGVMMNTGFGYVVAYNPQTRQITVAECGCEKCLEVRARGVV